MLDSRVSWVEEHPGQAVAVSVRPHVDAGPVDVVVGALGGGRKRAVLVEVAQAEADVDESEKQLGGAHGGKAWCLRRGHGASVELGG